MQTDFESWLKGMRGAIGSELPGYPGGSRLAEMQNGRSGGSTSNSNYAPSYTFNDRDDREQIVNDIDRRVDQRVMRTFRGRR
jgi:hypothetical protein